MRGCDDLLAGCMMRPAASGVCRPLKRRAAPAVTQACYSSTGFGAGMARDPSDSLEASS